MYQLFVEDLLNNSNATRLFDTLARIMLKKEKIDPFTDNSELR